ncbi:putative multidrug resistance protein 1 [Phaeomoniella chlamydospora]|uniref:Putative multidrug resistance protein 1 n=1 Tax=Phaeomoniella chlamydospora TaxID=158046 RepID=A0A0G2ETL3_PHACM|nr:putative multidrug resistance protein 1 [Phaeomoniella chlamydospora]
MPSSQQDTRKPSSLPWTSRLPDPRKGASWLRLLIKSGITGTDICLLVVGIIAAIAAGVPFALLGIIFGELINDMNDAVCYTSASTTATFSDGVKTKVLLIVYVTIANFVALYIHTGCWSLFGERLVRRIRKRYFHSLLKQDAAFFDTLPAGDVVSRLVNDIEIIQTGTSEKVGIVIASVSYFVASYVVAFLKAPKIAAMLISVIPVYFLMALGGGHYIAKYAGRIAKHADAANSIASSSLAAMPLVHAFNANRRLETLFAGHLSKTRRDSLKKALTHAIQLGLLYFVAYAANALAFWEGSREIAAVVAGKSSGVSVGDVYTVIFVLLDASFILSLTAPFIHIFSAAASSFERLQATIERQSSIDGIRPDGFDDFSFSVDDIEYKRVSFTYPTRPDVPALQDVSFCIPAKKHTAIVGTSGGGKSTVAALLERLYDPQSGEITVGGRNMKHLSVPSLRGRIGFVEQNSPLLNRSILENIAFGLLGSSHPEHESLKLAILDGTVHDLVAAIQDGKPQDQTLASAGTLAAKIWTLVENAIKAANAIDLVKSLPLGLATSVGTSGNEFSGGQKQRLALARALVREPELLLLDEATAALDSVSENLIQATLNEMSSKITTVTIAHRLATVKSADNIIVVQTGRVVEQGTHNELIEQDGVYARMVQIQQLGKPVLEKYFDAYLESGAETGSAMSTESTEIDEQIKPMEGSDETISVLHETGAKTHKNDESGESGSSFRRTLPHALQLVRPSRFYILIGLATSVVIGGSYSGEAVIFGHTIGDLAPCRGASNILASGRLYGLLFFILAIVELITVMINGSVFGRAAYNILFNVQTRSLHTLLRQSIYWHNSEGRTPGTLISVLTSDTTALSSLTGTTIGIIVSTVVNIFAGIILSHIVAWKIAIVLLATVPVLLTAGFMRLHVLAQFQERHQKQFAEATAITLEAVSNIKLVTAFSLQLGIYQDFSRALQGPYKATLKAIAHGNIWLSLAYSISNLVYALAYWWGSKQIVAGLYSQTQFFIVLPALLFSTQSCGQMFALAPDLTKARKAISNVIGLLQADSDDLAPNDSQCWPENEKRDVEAATTSELAPSEKSSFGIHVSIQDVHFSYPSRPDQEVLRGITVDIIPGQFCALVGPSGSGKSTVLSLLERFYTPSSGSVIIDHTDITRQHSSSFRNRISIVPQTNVLFEGSVAFNIGLGAHPGHEATQSEVEEACRLVGIHDFITTLPDGYDTICSNNGSQFSGGQKQRLSIARALVRKPGLLLLDESTSALDAESERLVQESLNTIREQGNVTIIAIAHRLNTIQKADRIFLIEAGQCVASGTHEELLRTSKLYRTSVVHQSLEV